MLKKIFIFAFSLFFLVSLLSFIVYLRSEQTASQIVRKLSAVRLAFTLYKVNNKKDAISPEELIKAGYLESIPAIKLKWKLACDKAEMRNTFNIKNTGCWAYVNNNKDSSFGLFYIDSSAKDPNGRDWSAL